MPTGIKVSCNTRDRAENLMMPFNRSNGSSSAVTKLSTCITCVVKIKKVKIAGNYRSYCWLTKQHLSMKRSPGQSKQTLSDT